jgi:Cof subfamily protein (haloacid dehalogenase superfamily)
VLTARRYAAMAGINAPAICTQGGTIYDYEHERVLFHFLLESELACEVLSFARQYPHWHPVLYRGENIYVPHLKYDRHFYAQWLIETEPIIVENGCEVLAGTQADKVLFVIEPEHTAHANVVLAQRFANQAVVVQSHAMFVEVNPLEAHKGAGLARIAKNYGIDQNEVLAIGDQENDKTMIAWAGVGVAMQNGSESAKSVADWVAPSISEDGAAIAIEKFALAV